MDLASLYIILGSISFVTSVVTLGVLIKKFIDQPAAHGFFVYSDTIASALLSLGLLLDGVRQPFLIIISILALHNYRQTKICSNCNPK